MKRSAWTQRFHVPLIILTWVGFIAILGLFGSYVFLLRSKEIAMQEMLYKELQSLREENYRLTEQNQQLEQEGCPSVSANPPLDPEAASQRSFQYTVQKGDTMWDIAAMYNVDVNDLMRWNNLTPRSQIFPGEQLTIILDE
jgi:cell division protein FtsB